MPSPYPSIVLVTPVFNDSRRLAVFGQELAQALADWDLDILWVIGDDGSTPSELNAVTSLIESFKQRYPSIKLNRLHKHVGKGGAIYSAWDHFPAAKLYGFVDADGAIDCLSLKQLLDTAQAYPNEAIAGIRQATPATRVEISFKRKILHKTFASVARTILPLSAKDPQCGAKLIPAVSYSSFRPNLTEPGMAFDCELLLQLSNQNIPIREVPISWSEMPSGSFRASNSALPMLKALFKIRKQHNRNY